MRRRVLNCGFSGGRFCDFESACSTEPKPRLKPQIFSCVQHEAKASPTDKSVGCHQKEDTYPTVVHEWMTFPSENHACIRGLPRENAEAKCLNLRFPVSP
jgi:hypothetical protein